ncbi:uncharacterized protein LOC124542670 isoform X1 [Vanessa cardui]|uniref:uncharacterized protein LOC124542670 isoform X1 n=1 Tax=Vanessa cardui TaxID=171605 RepID=UPI001F12F0F4|nr:uncharacterized protein LOC124542670 isoform X1 [Vanessa cardui]XP_046976556.1 uncharacterized protein LOC124542670 isoform X1 [Vanessa cardui]XP_046976562.1 uncharacterized protein LOC124542670 isoform X1 [Vanessa cardui]
MALVMLPCDLPWWTSVQRHLKHLLVASSPAKLMGSMLKIHDMCNIGIDPDDDIKDPELMKGLEVFIEEEMTEEERRNFLDNTIRIMVNKALHLKRWRPPKGLMFSLQQQSDVTELDYNFLSSLVAHAFFSTFPKRTLKSHPTLQDFNFTHFFKNLHRKSQRNKLKSLLHYFEWLDKNSNEGSIKLSRQVMTSKQWLTIEDWLECTLPLCKLLVRHEGRPERCENDEALRVCFASSRIGGEALLDGESQESLSMFMMPELLPAMLSVEALEDNEVLKVEGVRMFSRISDKRQKNNVELLDKPKTVTVCLMDAEDYSALPLGQWEEDNVLRELNKSLLAFQQTPMKCRDSQKHERRLSPIGESFSQTPPEVETTVMIKQASSSSTINSISSRSPSPQHYTATELNLNDTSVELQKRKCWLSPDAGTLNNRRGRFIVLGSSGECLPVTRTAHPNLDTQEDSLYSSCNSSDDEFHSANDSFDYGSEDEGRGESARPNSFQYSKELSTEERRISFADRLREALRREAENSCTTSTTGDWSTDSSSYAVGISISGAEVNDNDIRVKRGGSVGFVLTEKENMENGNRPPRLLSRKETGNSSKYSFSTEYTSELEEVYEQFNQWLNDPIVDNDSTENKNRELDSRDLAVIRFAGSLLKRTLSESMASGAGDGADAAELYGRDSRERSAPRRLALAARSLSLELARHRHRLAAHLKRKVKESIPEELLETSTNNNSENDNESRSIGSSTETCSTQVSNPINRKKKLNWVVNMIVETIEETVECEPVTIKIKKPKLNQLAHKIVTGGSCRPVATGNWGCGRRQRGHPQLKLLLQWLAASVAGVPALIYYTFGNDQLFKLDTLVRVLTDRKWTVGQLSRAVLKFSRQTLHEPHVIPDNHTLFDELIGIEKVPDNF